MVQQTLPEEYRVQRRRFEGVLERVKLYPSPTYRSSLVCRLIRCKAHLNVLEVLTKHVHSQVVISSDILLEPDALDSPHVRRFELGKTETEHF